MVVPWSMARAKRVRNFSDVRVRTAARLDYRLQLPFTISKFQSSSKQAGRPETSFYSLERAIQLTTTLTTRLELGRHCCYKQSAKMRLVHLVPTLFVTLGGNSQEQQQICNGLAFVGSNRYRSSSLLLAKEKSSSLLEESKGNIDSTTPRGQWLEKHFGFNEEELKKIFATNKGLLSLKVSVMEERANWLQKRLSLKDAELRKIILSHPNILSYTIQNNTEPKLDYYQERLGMDDVTLSKSIKKHPHLLRLSIEGNVEPKIIWLEQRLNVTNIDLGKLTAKAPNILGQSIEGNLEPKIAWLQKRLNLDEMQVRKLVIRYPIVLIKSLDENLKPKLDWLQSRLELNDAQAGKIARTLPSIFGYSVSNRVEPMLKWLQESLSLDEAGLTKMIVSQPALLGYDVKTNLEPTLTFYKECLGDEATKVVLIQHPVLLMVSLERRLKPRLEQARQTGVMIDPGCMQRIAKHTEEQWQRSLAFQEQKILKQRVW